MVPFRSLAGQDMMQKAASCLCVTWVEPLLASLLTPMLSAVKQSYTAPVDQPADHSKSAEPFHRCHIDMKLQANTSVTNKTY